MRVNWLARQCDVMTHQTPLDSVGHLHNLGLGEAVLLGGLLTHVLQQGHHGVEGGAVDKLRVGLTSLPLGLNTVSLLLHRLQSALLDRGVLEDGAVQRDCQYLTTHPAVVNILNLGPGNLHILTHVLSNGFAALGRDGVLLCGAVGGVIEERTSEQRETNLRVSSRQSVSGCSQEAEAEKGEHSAECCPGEMLPRSEAPREKLSL